MLTSPGQVFIKNTDSWDSSQTTESEPLDLEPRNLHSDKSLDACYTVSAIDLRERVTAPLCSGWGVGDWLDEPLEQERARAVQVSLPECHLLQDIDEARSPGQAVTNEQHK